MDVTVSSFIFFLQSVWIFFIIENDHSQPTLLLIQGKKTLNYHCQIGKPYATGVGFLSDDIKPVARKAPFCPSIPNLDSHFHQALKSSHLTHPSVILGRYVELMRLPTYRLLYIAGCLTLRTSMSKGNLSNIFLNTAT